MTDLDLARKRSIGKIRFYTHSFIVYGECSRAVTSCLEVCDKYSEKKWEKVKNEYGDIFNRQVVDKVFGTMFPDGKTFQFHKGQLKDFVNSLRRFQLTLDDFEVEVMPTYEPKHVEYKLKEGRVLRDYQENAKQFALAPVQGSDHFSKLIAMPTGTGKALSVDTLVKTRCGTIRIGDLRIGDEILGPDGKFTVVLGIYPQGLRQAFKVKFIDGRTVNADAQHLWDVYPDGMKDEPSTWTTETIRDHVDEYVVGNVAYDPPLHMDFEEYEILNEQFSSLIRRYGGFPYNKPMEQAFVGVKSDKDAEYAIELIRSMGGWAYRDTIVGLAGEDDVELVQFAVPRIADRIFDLINGKEHQDQRKHYINLNRQQTYIGIESVTPGLPTEMVCIEVDHPSNLFVLDNWIVTHNTVTSCGIAAEEKTRWLVSVLPKYGPKWGEDITANLDLKPKQVMYVDKTDGLRGLIDQCKKHGTKKLQPVVIITLTTLATFFKKWQDDPEGAIENYGCSPMELCQILDIGTVSIDESHEHILSVFLLAMHLHSVKFVCMSGTMQSEDPFQEMIQNLIFPEIKRYNDVKMEKYIHVQMLEYSINRQIRHKVRYQAFGRQDYSHVEFEKSIMRNPKLLQDFLDMYALIVREGYVARKVDGDKILVYAATVEMVNIILKDLRRRWPSLDMKRYTKTAGDDYKEFLAADVAVSTLQSSGTAVDIAGLISVLCTTMVNSGKTNLQALGRLRNLIGKMMIMFLPYCRDIRKHLGYTAYRKELFEPRVKTIKTFVYDRPLG